MYYFSFIIDIYVWFVKKVFLLYGLIMSKIQHMNSMHIYQLCSLLFGIHLLWA